LLRKSSSPPIVGAAKVDEESRVAAEARRELDGPLTKEKSNARHRLPATSVALPFAFVSDAWVRLMLGCSGARDRVLNQRSAENPADGSPTPRCGRSPRRCCAISIGHEERGFDEIRRQSCYRVHFRQEVGFMEALQGLVNLLAAEWRVIADAPITLAPITLVVIVLAIVAIVAIAAKFSSWWHGREINALVREKDTLNAFIKLKDTQIENLMTETARLTEELAKSNKNALLPVLAPVVYGNREIRDVFMEIARPRGPAIKLLGGPEKWSDEQIQEVAAAFRLQEAGLAKVEQWTNPTSLTVSSTALALTLSGIVDQHVGPHRKTKVAVAAMTRDDEIKG
jgi:hypothetical protein